MTCGSCQREAGTGPLCAACGAIQPFAPRALFDVLGLPRTYFLSIPALEGRFRDLSRKLHPDRFAQRSPPERRLSLDWTTALNEAYRTLKDPLRRAAYLLELSGLDVRHEAGKGAVPAELLEEVLDLRENLEGAKVAKDLPEVRALAKVVTGRAAQVQARLAEALQGFESSGERAWLEKAGTALAILKYFNRFQEEVEAIEMTSLE